MKTLDELVQQARVSAEHRETKLSLDAIQQQATALVEPPRGFAQVLQQGPAICGPVALIAEYKTASPSEGDISTADVSSIVKQYQQAGATALSILTEQESFGGSLEHIAQAKQASQLPVLRKDFITTQYQVLESRVAGADAILLIAAVLSTEQLKELAQLAHDVSLDVLYEVHSAEDISKVATLPDELVQVVGINSRDLATMEIDLQHFADLVPAVAEQLPSYVVIVAESGINTSDDVQFVRQHGAEAMLVGTSLMKADNSAEAVRTLLS